MLKTSTFYCFKFDYSSRILIYGRWLAYWRLYRQRESKLFIYLFIYLFYLFIYINSVAFQQSDFQRAVYYN